MQAPPYLLKVVRFLQNNNPSPLFFLGIFCLLQRIKEIIEWLRGEGYLITENYDIASILRERQNYQNVSPVTSDCGCGDLS